MTTRASAQATEEPAANGTSANDTPAGPPAPAPPADPKLEEARRHFALGIKLLRDPDGEQVEAAYLEFKTAYALSRSPRVLGNIGYCAMKLERTSEAIAAYGEYLRFVTNIDPRERAQIDDDLKTLTVGAAKIVITVPTGAEWTLLDARSPVRGQPITNTYGPFRDRIELLIHPGRHVIKGRIGTADQSTWEVDAAGGATLTHEFTVAPAAKTVTERSVSRPSRVAPWVITGVGAAAVVAGAVTGVMTLNKVSSLEEMCPNNACPADSGFRSDVSSARTLGTVTDVLLIGGGLAVATGVTWLLFTSGGSEAAAPAPASAPAVGAAWLPGGGAAATVRVTY